MDQVLAAEKRPNPVETITHAVETGCGKIYVRVGFVYDRPIEVFINLGKAGSCAKCNNEALGVALSSMAQQGADLLAFAQYMCGLSCNQPTPGERGSSTRILSCQDAVGKAILICHKKWMLLHPEIPLLPKETYAPRFSLGKQPIVAVDFDGTIVTPEFPNIGRLRAGAKEALLRLQEMGYYVIIWSCRDGDWVTKAQDFLREQGIPFDAFNENAARTLKPDGDWPGINPRKIFANLYIDDQSWPPFPGWDVFLFCMERGDFPQI